MTQTHIKKDNKEYFVKLTDGEYDKYGGFKPSGINIEDPMVIHVALKEVEKIIEQIHSIKYMKIETATIKTKHFTIEYKAPVETYFGNINVLRQNFQLTQGETE